MSKSEEKLNQLHTRLENLAKYEAAFKREIADIRRDIRLLKDNPVDLKSSSPQTQTPKTERHVKSDPAPPKRPAGKTPAPKQRPVSRSETPFENYSTVQSRKANSNIEKFVGTYLISVIGVLITVIGVGIGAKYAIDNELISPLFRIILGYLSGLILTGVAVQLKAKYESFSAVLLSGGMAILYFITYFAYDFYSLISQTTAFSLMVIFTIFTVSAAVIYSRQIIAHIGLVGAYAVPFLLSEGAGNAAILFGYIAIINIGILAVSIKRYWRILFYAAFVFTWLIFAAWYAERFVVDVHFALSLVSITVFYLSFYCTFLIYKLIHKKPFGIENVTLVLANSFVFFGFGYSILKSGGWDEYLGLFTVSNAALHFAVAHLIHRYKLGDRNALYFVAALVITFLTIAVPVQVRGNWITVLWMAEAFFLFAAGRIKNVRLFEYLSYPLIFLGSASLLSDWQEADYRLYNEIAGGRVPLYSAEFATSLFSTISFCGIFVVNRLEKYRKNVDKDVYRFLRYLLPTLFLAVLYNTFRSEIAAYFYSREWPDWPQEGPRFSHEMPKGGNIGSLLNIIWQLNYSMLFGSVLVYLNVRKFKNAVLGSAGLGLIAVLAFVFMTLGLLSLGQLREMYLLPQYDQRYYLFFVRYVSLLFVAGMIYIGFKQVERPDLREFIPGQATKIAYELGVCILLLTVLSAELLNWADIFQWNEPQKLGLSILWGVYAVALIITGIARQVKHIRIFAISLFAVTLAKLFLYDMENLATIPKTILFVSIGIMLLVASFLYNKYTKFIFDKETD
jgi:hypothetical protein